MVQLARPTIQDVAAHAKVKVSTVSRVLNGRPDVSQATRERVLTIIDELGYVPSRAAQSFRTGKTQAVSIMLPMIGTEFYNRLIAALDKALAAHDYDAALFPLLNEKRLERYLKPNALPYQTDAMVFASLNPDWLFPQAKVPTALPTVLLDAYHPAYDTVTVNNQQGAYDATRLLLERPSPTFALIVEERYDTPFSSGVFLERQRGFERALREAGHENPDTQVITIEFEREAAQRATAELLERVSLPLNIFASCDLIARGALDELGKRHVVTGEGVRIVGFDNQPWAEAAGLSTVHQPIERMADEAIVLLFERLRNERKEVRHIELAPHLVIRDSTRAINHRSE